MTRILILKKRLILRDRIQQIIDAKGGQYRGFRELVDEAETSSSALAYQLRRLAERGAIRWIPGGRGLNNKTIIELVKS